MNERLRIALLVSELSVGGAERQLLELAAGLDRQRFEPAIVTFYPNGPLDAEAQRRGVRLVCLNRRGKLDFTTLFALTRFLRDERIHVVQPFLTPATFFGLIAGSLAGTPVRIATERGGTKRARRILHPYAIAEYRLMRSCDVIVANSHSGCDDLVTRGLRPEQMRVIYNGVNADRIAVGPGEGLEARRRLGVPEGAKLAGVVARLEPMKDHETFLRAARNVLGRVPDAYFALLGEGSLRAQLEAQTETLGLQERVIFAGREVRVAPFIDAFDLLVLPSKEKEGCSNALLEALGMSTPVVCTAAGGNQEVIVDGETGLVVPPQDAEALASAMTSLLLDPERGREMGRRGREAFERGFTLDVMVHAYEELWTALVREAAGTPVAAEGSQVGS